MLFLDVLFFPFSFLKGSAIYRLSTRVMHFLGLNLVRISFENHTDSVEIVGTSRWLFLNSLKIVKFLGGCWCLEFFLPKTC